MKKIAGFSLVAVSILFTLNCTKEAISIVVPEPTVVGKWNFIEATGAVVDVNGQVNEYNKNAAAAHFVDLKADGSFYTNGDGIDCETCPLGEETAGRYTVDAAKSEITFTSTHYTPGKPDFVLVAKLNLLTDNQLNLEIDKATTVASYKASQFDANEIQAFDSFVKSLDGVTYLTR